MAAALEARDPYTHGHSRRVARFSVLIAKRIGLPEEDVARVRTAAAVHDVGKIKLSRAVLNKRGKLTDEEFALIKRHAQDSARMVQRLGDEQLTAIVRHHHERLDGTGYPDRLSGEDVPLGSRIIAVADTFDALTSRRPYRCSASSHQKALDVLAAEAGTQLDPNAVRAFRSYYSGRRALTLWNGATLLPERLLSAIGSGLHSGAAASGGQLLAAAAASTLIGGGPLSSRRSSTSSGGHAPGSGAGSTTVQPAGSTQRTSPAPGAAAGDSRSGAGGSSTATGGSGGGSGGSSAGSPLPDVPAAGGGVVPKLPNPGGLLPGASSGGGVLPGAPVGWLVPTAPAAGALLPKGAASLTDQSGLTGAAR